VSGTGLSSRSRTREDPIVYVVNASQQFGTVDLAAGSFHAISNTPAAQSNLVWGPDGSLLSLSVSGNLAGNLVRINPVSGVVTSIGPTGLGFNAFDLAEVRGKLYLTDFSNNIYSVDSQTGAATLLRATGMPPDPTIPFTFDEQGNLNLCDESLYAVGGKLYATFDSFAVDPKNLAITTHVPPALYQIDPSTGDATSVGPTDLQLGASVEVNGQFYAFRLVITAISDGFPQAHSQLVRLDLASGKTSFMRNIDPAAGPIFGAAPVRSRRWIGAQ
jgi:hypothetical protein